MWIFEVNHVWIFHIAYPQRGPPLLKSKTWWGLSNFLKLFISWRPWPPPLFPLTKTKRGHTVGGSMDGFTVGSSITTKKRMTKSHRFCIPVYFFGKVFIVHNLTLFINEQFWPVTLKLKNFGFVEIPCNNMYIG